MQTTPESIGGGFCMRAKIVAEIQKHYWTLGVVAPDPGAVVPAEGVVS